MRMEEIREALYLKAEEHADPRLAELADATKRRPKFRPGTVGTRTMSPQIREEILRMRIAFPDMAQVDIARTVNVNPGRVSEILRGVRK